jgi:hypothetical protein
MNMRRILLGISILALPLSVARADLAIEMKHNNQPMTTYAAGHNVASEFGTTGMVFLGQEKVLDILDHDKKKVTEVTEADAKALADQLAQAQQAMASMPPAIRDKMKSAMMGKMPGAAPRTVKPMGKTQEINGYATTGYLVTVEGSTDQTEVWATDPKALGFTKEDLTAFADLAAFMQTMLPGLDTMRDLIKNYDKPSANDVPGVPVPTIQRDKDGKEAWRSELVSVKHDPVPASKFTVPDGYKKEKLKTGR